MQHIRSITFQNNNLCFDTSIPTEDETYQISVTLEKRESATKRWLFLKNTNQNHLQNYRVTACLKYYFRTVLLFRRMLQGQLIADKSGSLKTNFREKLIDQAVQRISLEITSI